MKHTEIEAIFTAKVTEFITKGYTINTATMSGHQGEISKIDFRKGNDVYRVMLEQTTEFKEHGARELVILTVGRSTEDVIRDDQPFNTMGPTFWNNKMEILEQRKFYQIDRRADYFIEDVDAYDAMQKKQHQRYRNNPEKHSWGCHKQELPEAAGQIAKRYIKRVTGKTRVSDKEIKVTKVTYEGERPKYYAEYRGKSYKIA